MPKNAFGATTEELRLYQRPLHWDRGRLARQASSDASTLEKTSCETSFALPAHGGDARGPSKARGRLLPLLTLFPDVSHSNIYPRIASPGSCPKTSETESRTYLSGQETSACGPETSNSQPQRLRSGSQTFRDATEKLIVASSKFILASRNFADAIQKSIFAILKTFVASRNLRDATLKFKLATMKFKRATTIIRTPENKAK